MDAPLPLRRQLRQSGSVVRPLNREGASIMKITTVGVDLAKIVFQIHGVDERGKAVLRKQLKRTEMLSFFANLPPCLIGMEACSSAHHWARKLIALGHEVRLMAPQFVKPYVKTDKNDRNDAEAICEAAARPNMRLSAGENARTTDRARLAPRASRICESAHRAGQSDTRPAERVRNHPAPRHRSAISPRTADLGGYRQWSSRTDACTAEQAARAAQRTRSAGGRAQGRDSYLAPAQRG